MTFPRVLTRPPVVAAITATAAFVVYYATLSRSVGFIDAGELSTVAWTLGIAHPTGYPLFTLFGWLFSHLPLSSEIVVRLNIMAAFWCAAGLFFFFLFIHDLLQMIGRSLDAPKNVAGEEKERLLLVVAASSTIFLAFSETYWSQAVAVEVYSLHLFFVNLLLYVFARACLGVGTPRWFLFAFVLGLSFTNHMTTILLAPGFLYLYFATQGWDGGSWRRIGTMVPSFVVGLSAYVLIPIRASMSPPMNWGNATTFERFLWHFSGKQYRVWIFSSTEAAGKQFAYFLSSLPAEFAYVGIPLALAGLIVLWRNQRTVALATIVLFAGCVFYSINYDIHDIDSYFLLAYLCMAVWSAIALLAITWWTIGRWQWKAVWAGVFVAAMGCSTCVVHYAHTDESTNFLVEDYTHNMFASLQPDAIVLSYQWDYWLSASYYYQLVKGERRDLTIIDKELLRRTWYIRSLQKSAPDLMRKSSPEVEAFLIEVDKFEHDRPYNPQVIEARYTAMIASFIAKNIADRPVYVTGEIEPGYTRGYQRVPSGLAFRLYADHGFHSADSFSFTYRQFARAGRLEDMMRRFYSDATLARNLYMRNAPK